MRHGHRPIPPPQPAPPLRAPGVPLPPYRYVPGLLPHPFRHPDGHAYTAGHAPAEVPWAPGDWRTDLRWLHGLDLFDQRYYWECHESLEGLWRQLERGTPEADLLQGLIQAAASVLKRHCDQDLGAGRLLGRARARLLAVAQARGPCWWGIDLPATVAALDNHAVGGPWPLLGRAA